MSKTIVISAVNLVEGGPLTILNGCLEYLSSNLADKYPVFALVNRKTQFTSPNIRFLEFPAAKKSWINRLFYEYMYFFELSKRLKPFLWLSLHDITPNVLAEKVAVYCHNASSFYKLPLRQAVLDPRFALFNLFYRYLYGINIKKSDFVIVQQNWLRQEMMRLYGVRDVIVAHPQDCHQSLAKQPKDITAKDGVVVFIYPSFPRVFKNFEVICRACDTLAGEGIENFKVIFTISGLENRYSRHIHHSFKHLKNIEFLGIQSQNNLLDLYAKADCMIFPSKLETWGLPISEFKQYDKPILLAQLPYAKETLGSYRKARFFSPDNHTQLAYFMKSFIQKENIFENIEPDIIQRPFSENWKELFEILLATP